MKQQDRENNFEFIFTGDTDSEEFFDGNELQTLYYYNRDDPFAIYVDEKENAIDSLETIIQFLDRIDNLKWKWIVFALHHSLYCFCISALKRGNYYLVLDRGSKQDNKIYVQIGNEPKPKKSSIKWFYIGTNKTPAYRIEGKEVDEIPPEHSKLRSKNKLIGFWTALARVQDQYFWMGSMHGQSALKISDDELKKIFWLIEYVRNDLTHFVPKGYSIDILSIIDACKVVLDKIDYLVFQSYAITFYRYNQEINRVRKTLDIIYDKIGAEKKHIASKLKNKKG